MEQFGKVYNTIAWIHGNITIGPFPIPYAILSVSVTKTGFRAYIHGYSISATEMNDFYIVWTTNGVSTQYYITHGSEGTTLKTFRIALNNTTPIEYGDSVTIYIYNAVGAAQAYQVSLLLGEERVK
jgi:hypothetical protein